MQISIDTIIFIIFMLLNLAVGLYYGRTVKDAKDYAIGGRNFATHTLTATVIATYIGGGFITAALTESYRQGLYFIIPVLGEPLALVVTGYFLAPHMAEFFGKQSVAEAMGDLYGSTVRVITALAGTVKSIGILALQFKVGALIMQVFVDVSGSYAVILSSIVVIIYSAFGGVRSVTYTDLLQFFTFCVIVPIICLFVWKENNPSQVLYNLATNPLFDFTQVVSPNNPRFLALICLFLYFIIPSVDPAYFQRVSMAKGIKQAQRAFITGGVVSIIILLVVCSTSVVLLTSNPDLDPINLLPYIIENYTFPVLKGLASVGIMAAVMSTADSYLNSASVLFNNDVLGVLGLNKYHSQKQLKYLRIISLVLGIGAFGIAYRADGLFNILIMTMSIYMPVISAPLLLAICGFRSSTKVVLIGMMAGILVVLFWSDFYRHAQLDGFSSEVLEETNEAIPGMLANLIAFIIAHLICGKPKGKGGAPSKVTPGSQNNQQSKGSYRDFFNSIQFKHISLKDFYKANSYQDDSLYVFAGAFSAIMTFSMAYLVNVAPDITTYFLVYCISLIFSFVLIVCPIWIPISREKYLILCRVIAVPLVLIFIPMTFAVMGQFGSYQAIILLLNILTFLCLAKWRMAAIVITIASCLSIKFCELNPTLMHDLIYYKLQLQLQIISLLLFTIGILITFFRSKQSKDELLEDKINYLEHASKDQNHEISHLSNIKKEFLRNLQHETNTPLTGIYSMSQALSDCYSKLSDEQRKNVIESIKTSSERLISYVHNLVDVSKLMTQKFKLDIRTVNLSKLLAETIIKCKRLYIPKETEDYLDIILDIEPNITIRCDEYLLTRCFENLIINAIQYCKKGTIEITLRQDEGKITFSVKDSGIGIPKEDLTNIFEPFTTSSRTKTPAGGRGLGLTLVKEAAAILGGSVTVQNSEGAGSCFIMSFYAHNTLT